MITIARDERRAGNEARIFVVLTLILVAYFAQSLDQPIIIFTICALLVLAVVLYRSVMRCRPICVIEPNRVGYGSEGDTMCWLNRAGLGSVRIGWAEEGASVQFFGLDGEFLGAQLFANFDREELRRAFRSTGIVVR